jgi:type I restriction enzyme M protein
VVAEVLAVLSDRGSESTSAACVDGCDQLGLRRSMGRTGSCLDSAVAESVFVTLKVELVDRQQYRTRAEARASIFLQLVIRMLKDGGRCGIVAPNGVLFGEGVGVRIKQQLLADCNLHTVVRLPDGVFEPYTAIPSNLLFFDKAGSTKQVWFYEIPRPEGRKKYSKTKPMRFEEFADCQAWWSKRIESERAWRVPITDIEANGYNLDLRNPNRPDDLAHRPPAELLAELVSTEREILGLLEKLQVEVGDQA